MRAASARRRRPPFLVEAVTSLGMVLAIGAFGVGGFAGCIPTMVSTTERQADGTFRLKCQASLPACLQKAEEACRGTRYTVLSAADHHDYMGSQGSVGESEVRASEAVIRCGPRGKRLFGDDKDTVTAVASGPPPSAEAQPPPAHPATPARACVPGSTQTCVGPAACRGGQACLPDGQGFSACDCGGGGQGSPPGNAAPAGDAAPGPSPWPAAP